MIKRATVLLSSVALFVATVLLLPDAVPMKPSRLAKRLPKSVGEWQGRPEEISAREKQVLAADTEFERISYQHQVGTYPQIQASIVFSGKNLSQSIHRPEVCLRAQGWTFVKERYFDWEGLFPDGEVLPVKEIICSRVHQYKDEEGEIQTLTRPDGSPALIWRSFYYCFFGHTTILAGHYERTGEDIKDRLFGGYDQRWAYATFSTFITKKHADQGLNPPNMVSLDEEGTKNLIGTFLQQLLPVVVAPPKAGVDPSLADGILVQ